MGVDLGHLGGMVQLLRRSRSMETRLHRISCRLACRVQLLRRSRSMETIWLKHGGLAGSLVQLLRRSRSMETAGSQFLFCAMFGFSCSGESQSMEIVPVSCQAPEL